MQAQACIQVHTKKYIHAHTFKNTPLCVIIHTQTHTQSSCKLLCWTDSKHWITLQQQLENAFKLCVVSIGFCSPCGEEPHKAFRHQRHRTTEIANCKNTNWGSEGCCWVAVRKNHANKQRSVISAPLESSFLLIWPSACFTPGWLNVLLGPEMCAEGWTAMRQRRCMNTQTHACTYQADLCAFKFIFG